MTDAATTVMTKQRNGFHQSSQHQDTTITQNGSAVSAPLNSGGAMRMPSPSSNPTIARVKKRKQSESSGKSSSFTWMLVGCVVLLGSIQFLLNAVLFHVVDDQQNTSQGPPLSVQIASIQRQLYDLQSLAPDALYVDDGNFYPFSIRDSRRLVPTQIPPGFHIWDYVDITTQNQQTTKRASLFHNAIYQAPAACQTYDLHCYKDKILQVFDLVLEQNPHTNYFFYMEADNELCVPLGEIRRIAYQYARYFITTGIGFSGWIMHRDFMVDFLQALRDYVAPPKDPKDILNIDGKPDPSEGPDPIASVMLIEKQAWTVTRQYLVSHSIQPSLGMQALTVKMPDSEQEGIVTAPQAVTSAAAANNDPAKPQGAAGALKKPVGLEKHLPRCFEPRRSKWRISKHDHRDRFGWDYFDYDECKPTEEVFPCYVGQLEDLLAKDMAQFNYTELDMERKKLIEKQQQRQRQKILQAQAKAKLQEGQAQEGGGGAGADANAGGIVGIADGVEGGERKPTLQERLKELTEKARQRHLDRIKNKLAGGGDAADANSESIHFFPGLRGAGAR